jgi:UDP-N-acetylglucosamine:LPS N-acetylglucosamine transferase
VKKILILTAGYGEGHNSAARGIQAGLVRTAPGVQVEVHDLFAETYGRPNNWLRRGYLTLINNWPRAWGLVYRWLDQKKDFDQSFRSRWFAPVKRHLADLLQRFQPDVVVSVFPAYPYLLQQVQPDRTFRSVVVVTDSITVNAIWYHCPADVFLVPNEQSAAVVREAGIGPEKIRTFGFPVNPRFADLPRREPPSARERPRVLYMINAGTGRAPEITRRLCQLDIDLTVTVGREEKLRQVIAHAAGDQKITIIGWTDQLPELLCQSHVLIGKAGGATVQEAVAAGCPMIINHIVSGQEEGNAQLIVTTQSGTVAHAPAEVVAQVQQLFGADASLWRQWSAHIAALSRPRASLEIADFLMAL